MCLMSLCSVWVCLEGALFYQFVSVPTWYPVLTPLLQIFKENGCSNCWHTKKLIWETCLPADSCPTSHTPAMLSSSADIPGIKHHNACRERTYLQVLHAPPKSSTWETTPVPAQTDNTEFLPTCLLTLTNILCFLLSFLFTWPGIGLASAWLWDLYVVIDCLAGETRQLSVKLLQQFVTTQIYRSPHCHKSYRK